MPDDVPEFYRPDDITAERIRRKLLPVSVHGSLLKAAGFITVWELLKTEVLQAPYRHLHPRSTDESTEWFDAILTGRFVVTERYRSAVLHTDRDKYRAAARWLVKEEAIEERDYVELLAIREYRNRVAHELASFLLDIGTEIDAGKFASCADLLGRVARWRIAGQAPEGAVPMVTLMPKMLGELFEAIEKAEGAVRDE